MTETVDISGLDKADVLCALVNNGRVLGLGALQDIGRDITRKDAEELLDLGADHERMFPSAKKSFDRDKEEGRIYFDYVFGKPIKTDIGPDQIDPWGYDRDNGRGACARVIAKLRASLQDA